MDLLKYRPGSHLCNLRIDAAYRNPALQPKNNRGLRFHYMALHESTLDVTVVMPCLNEADTLAMYRNGVFHHVEPEQRSLLCWKGTW
jgi:hypothetical protein